MKEENLALLAIIPNWRSGKLWTPSSVSCVGYGPVFLQPPVCQDMLLYQVFKSYIFWMLHDKVSGAGQGDARL